MDKILLDTNIAWALSSDNVIGAALKSFFRVLGNGYMILYSEASIEELRMITTPREFIAIMNILSSIASKSSISIDLLRRRIGRYNRTVKKIGTHDVLIALNAFEEDAVLATGDWPQASFYMGLSGNKPVFIPLKQLEK